jgi:hypothetical protein
LTEESEKHDISLLADLEKSDLFFPGLVLSNLPALHNPEVAFYFFLGNSAYQRSYFSEEVTGSKLCWFEFHSPFSTGISK